MESEDIMTRVIGRNNLTFPASLMIPVVVFVSLDQSLFIARKRVFTVHVCFLLKRNRDSSVFFVILVMISHDTQVFARYSHSFISCVCLSGSFDVVSDPSSLFDAFLVVSNL